jgi:HD superfamily phosphodiesterase
VQFAFTIGNGQSAQLATYSVNGTQFVNVIASTLEVDAINNNASTATASASAAPANGPDRSPDTSTNATRVLAAGVQQTVLASGRAYAIIHNDTAAALQVRINSLTFANIAAQGNYKLDYSGAFQLFSTTGGSVNVAEFWK